MKLYMAPMEGITVRTYRDIFTRHYGGADKLFTPFIAAEGSRRMKKRELDDIALGSNNGILVVPQIISNNSDNFVRFARIINEYGYREVNLNLGCPSGTVVSKGKGAGFLGNTSKLDRFLDTICRELSDMDISVKTRIGLRSPDEIEELMEIFNRYPIHELIIHPRVRDDYYNGEPRMEEFMYAYKVSRNPVCYNGDIKSADDYNRIISLCGRDIPVMAGRGLIRNPALFNIIRNRAAYGGNEKEDKNADRERLKKFHDEIYGEYRITMPGETVVIYKMKEIWRYMMDLFEENEAYARLLKKSHNIVQYNVFAGRIFAECALKGE